MFDRELAHSLMVQISIYSVLFFLFFLLDLV